MRALDIFAGAGGWDQSDTLAGAYRLTIQEAATLQTFPADFPFEGSMWKQFAQVGNAVPPLLAEALLRTLGGDSK